MFKSGFIRNLWLLVPAFTLCHGMASGQEIPDSTMPVAETKEIMQVLESEDFNRILDRAIAYQLRADQLERKAVEWRKEASKMDDPVERGKLQKQIIRVEDSLDIYTGLANEQIMILSDRIPEGAEQPNGNPFLVKDTVLNGITVYNYNLNDAFLARLEEIRQPSEGSGGSGEMTAGLTDVKTGVETENKTEAEERIEAVKSYADGSSPPEAGFSIQDRSPYGQGRPFEEDYAIPSGVFYRIQISVFRNPPPYDQFGGLSPITTERIPGKDLTRYFAGKFTHMGNAKTALDKVRSLGYPDAFIVGYYNGKKSSFSKLKALEE